uniref:probable Ras GTPase-activating protein isoform X3 n=1 Tax=Ciona intestinalis TaxID=7719 RepID=UPI00089DB22D|nr:probable Ras GTPase-activating protein isoform X3 [Ciona intestinalis]|eukprot:XP_018670524.1 probable Ras GTPase-activating protein isoform X3 [Ciona intestinalis]
MDTHPPLSPSAYPPRPHCYSETRRKSYEAEDGPAILRSLSASRTRGKTRNTVSDLPLLADSIFECSSSLSLMDRDTYETHSSGSLPRCSSDCSALIQPSSRNVEVKRNHSLKNFLQRKIPPIRRSKSTKLSSGKENRPQDINALMAQGGPPKPEVELPFFMPAIESPDTLDLTSSPSDYDGAIVRPLHHSILGKDHCFEVVTHKGDSRCFGCDSAGEREAWIEKIKRTINPNLDNSRRIEHQLTLFVQEAKGLPTKKRYFCEICLDRKLCARTTSKLKNDSSVLWSEHFEFSSMPHIEDITVHLYKDSDKKKKKDKDYIGLVNLPVKTLANQQTLEKWYTLSTPSGNNKGKAGESMAVRIKARFLSTRVLPTEHYKSFAEHISGNYLHICQTLRNSLSVARKDEFARIMVNVMYGTGSIKEYMGDVVMDEVDKVEEESLIFRENTIGTKSVEAFLRLVGMGYLYNTLGEFISALFSMEEDCEVDGSRLPPHASLDANQKNLQMSCEIALCKITSSVNNFPSELREVMSQWRLHCEANNRPRIANRLVTASLFLRLLCPAILNPSLFGLANEIPDPKTSRTLTLIAKVIQNLANRSRFGSKEEYMKFMDVFIREKWDDMGGFISNVSDPHVPSLCKGFEGFVDLGKEFAKLHSFFVEVIPTLEQTVVNELGSLPPILQKITEALESPTITPPHRKTSASHHLEQIVEDPSIVGGSELTPGSSSTPMIGRKYGGGAAASMGDLRDFTNGHFDCDASGFANGYSPSHHVSHSALPASINNNNNIGWPLSSTENLVFNKQQQEQQPALMYANPAYHQQQQQQQQQQQRGKTRQQERNNAQYGNNKQKTTPQQYPSKTTSSKHLETVFGSETVTYTNSPAQHRRAKIYLEPSTPPSVEDSEETRSKDSSLSSRESSTTTATNSSSSDVRINRDAKMDGGKEDDDVLMSAQSILSAPVHSAQLKKGLQFRSKNEKPLPKPRSSLGGGGDRKMSVPCLPSHRVYTPARRGSADTVRTSGSKIPTLHLALDEHDAILELSEIVEGESPSNERRMRQNENSMSSKDQDGFVTAPVTAVKSRVVVATSNAARVKTSRHATSATQQKQPHNPQNQGRRSSHHKPSNPIKPPEPQQNPTLPPSTPEGPLSPEARTAQWILNNVATPNKEKNEDGHTVLTPKDYEDRIIRLETEVERLRASVSSGLEVQRNLESKESHLVEKVRRTQRSLEQMVSSEEKWKKQKEEKEEKVREMVERLTTVETAHHRERTELRALLDSKESLIREQHDRITRLEETNLRLISSIKRIRTRDSPSTSASVARPNDVINFIDDDVDDKRHEHRRHRDVKATAQENGGFCLHGLSSASSSSSV